MRTAAKGFLFFLAVLGISSTSVGLWEWYRTSHKNETTEKPVAKEEKKTNDSEFLTSVDSLKNLKEMITSFEKFEQDYNKNYDNEESRTAHFKIFVKNVEYINNFNAKSKNVELAINEFADIHPEHFAKTRLGLNAKKPDMMRKFNSAHLGTFTADPNVKVPSSVNWVEKGAVTPVKNQGQCGSCWSFSTTGALEGRWQILTGKLCSMSEQQFVDCDTEHDHGCNGGLMDYAFEFAENNALCSEESFPYTAKGEKCPADLKCDVCVPKGSVTGFQDVESNSVEAMEQAVAAGPVSVAVEADQGVFQFYKKGVVTSAECGQQLDHGVLTVGYGTYTPENSETAEGIDYWLVKNSWGPSWGEDGYLKIAKKLSISGKSECGILSQPSFPVMKEQSSTEQFQEVQFI